MQVVVSNLAKDDIDRGFAFYASGGENLGIRFVETILDRLKVLESTAGIHAKVFGHYRLLAKPFPYVIYYDIEDGVVVVRAVLDWRRSPKLHRRRARG